MLMTPQQCKAARKKLGISPEILSGYAGTSRETIIGFEEQTIPVPTSIVESIQVALEYAGIEFLEPNAPDSRMVCLRCHYVANPHCFTQCHLDKDMK
jgi:DNA-binding XRE family transcriptional regulator